MKTLVTVALALSLTATTAAMAGSHSRMKKTLDVKDLRANSCWYQEKVRKEEILKKELEFKRAEAKKKSREASIDRHRTYLERAVYTTKRDYEIARQKLLDFEKKVIAEVEREFRNR